MFFSQHKLALLELQLSRRLSSLALQHNHFPVSAPDFSKSVVLEVSFLLLSLNKYFGVDWLLSFLPTKNMLFIINQGCGFPYFDPNSALALRPGGECGDPESGTAMHLVGGASLPALVAYFAR